MPHNGPNESFPSLDVTPHRRFARAQPTQVHEEAHPNDLPPSGELYVPPHRWTQSQVTSHPSESRTHSQVIIEPSGPRTPPGPRSTRVPEWRARSRSGAVSHHPLDTFSGPRILPPPGYIPPWRAKWLSNTGDYQGSGPFTPINALPDQERRHGDSSPSAPGWPFFSDDILDSDSHDGQSDSSEDNPVSQNSRASEEPIVSRPIDFLNRPGPISIPEPMPPPPPPPNSPVNDAVQLDSFGLARHLGEIASSSSSPSPPASPRPSFAQLPPASPRPSFAKLPGPTLSRDRRDRSVSPPLSPRRTPGPSSGISRVLHGRIHRPRLSIITPRMMPVKPYDRPPPDYEEWHPTTIVIEYQIRRGLGFSKPLYQLCDFLNKGQAYTKHKMIVKGIEHRVSWLLRYEDEVVIKRMERYEKERAKWRRQAQELGQDVLRKDGSTDEEAGSRKDKVKKQPRFMELLEEDEAELLPDAPDLEAAQLPDYADLEDGEIETTDVSMEDDDATIDEMIQAQLQDEYDNELKSRERENVEGEGPAITEGSSSTVAAEGAVARARDDAVEETEVGWNHYFAALRRTGCHLA
ncbi:MAG: hypothetical protein LQ350_000073 [Teloschistes chrysophthalmus]|nr:MAG: hypothetical protein LQ350_000073 [Niorma chrysophthalma]